MTNQDWPDNPSRDQKKPQPNQPAANPKNETNPTRVDNKSSDPNKQFHPMIAPDKPFEGSGKENNQISQPIVAMNTTEAPQGGSNQDVGQQTFDGALDKVISQASEDTNSQISFNELEVGQALFLPVTAGKTVDKMVEEMHKTVEQERKRYGEVIKDENGDEVWAQVVIKTRQRNDDGTIQLENGRPVEGANHSIYPMYAYNRNFIVRGVTGEQEISDSAKAPGDGVLIIRVS